MFLKAVLLKTVHLKTVFAFPEASSADKDMINSVMAVLIDVPKVQRRSWTSASSAEPLALTDGVVSISAPTSAQPSASASMISDVVENMQSKFEAIYDLIGEDRNECKCRLILENNFRCLLGIGSFFVVSRIL